MARPKGFEPLFSGIGIRCVIQLRHGRMVDLPISIIIHFFAHVNLCDKKLRLPVLPDKRSIDQ